MTQTDCKAAQELLHDYLSGETSPEQGAWIDSHLGSCEPCQRTFESWQQFRSDVRRAGRGVPVPSHVRAAVMERVRAVAAPGVVPRRRATRALAAALAALLLVVLGVALVLNRPGPTPAPVAGDPTSIPSAKAVALTPQPMGHVPRLLVALVGDHRMHGEMVASPASAVRQDQALQDYGRVLGAPVEVPSSLGGSYRREQCMLCPVGSERLPHVQYRLGARAVSLFLAPAESLIVDGRSASILPDGAAYTAGLDRENLVMWRSGKTVYVLVSRESPDTMMQLAADFKHGS